MAAEKTYKYFWKNRITGDTARHRTRGVKNATDFYAPIGSPLRAPFAGEVSYRWFNDSGWRVQIENDKWICQLSHCMSDRGPRVKGNAPYKVRKGKRPWRSIIAYAGMTGNTDGPHVHAVIYNKKTGARYSFAEWLIMRKGKAFVPKNMRKAIKEGVVKPIK